MKAARRRNGELADYEHPPVIEVVYGATFTPLKAWKLPHLGLFWNQILDEFPRCEQVHPIPGTEMLDPSTGLPIPRVWLISADDDQLVQLQPGRFLFNWRYRDVTGPYPRYETLSDRFFSLFHKFEDFVATNSLGKIELSGFELTYINHIIENEDWKFPESIGRVMEHLAWRKERYHFLPKPFPINWQVRFDFPEAEGPGALYVKLSPAKHVKHKKDMIVLELSCRGLPAEAPRDHMNKWFGVARRWIVRGFEDMTSKEAQNSLWGKHAKP